MNDQYYITSDRLLNKYLNYAAYHLWEDFHIEIENVDIDMFLRWGTTYMNDEHDPRTCAKDYFDAADDKLLAKAKLGSALQEGSKNTSTR